MQKAYLGVDLSNYNCHQLRPDPLYANYQKQDLHFPIGALQKGQRPHTKIGIKRIKRKNIKKARKTAKIKKEDKLQPLIPKSPEEICMKALRSSFRNSLEENHLHVESSQKGKAKGKGLRKAHQRKRRIELIKLVEKYKNVLRAHFGKRLDGFGVNGRCPKVSRKEVQEYLRSQGTRAEVNKLESTLSKQNNKKGKVKGPTIIRATNEDWEKEVNWQVPAINQASQVKVNLKSEQEFPRLS